MAEASRSIERIPGYCGLCVSRCGSIATVEGGRFVALDPDPAHPTGRALCAKGRAAPELVYHPERLRHPLRRTRPKGDPDPGWERIGWDEALDLVAERLAAIAAQDGPESVVFSVASPSTSGSDDTTAWISRLMNAFGTPNLCASMELCGWGRYLAPTYTYGAAVPGAYMPDLERAGCILYWGYNPNVARIAHATATVDALKRGARLIVVDPRRAGPAAKADLWLQVRPGTDAALALGIAAVMIERGWYDRDFVREWTNGPLLVRADTGRFLTEADLANGSPERYVAWDEAAGRPTVYDPATGRYGGEELALVGTFRVDTPGGEVACRPAFDLVAEGSRRYPPERVEAICGVPAGQVVDAARMLWASRPVAYYAWSGVEQQTNATQISRAIGQLYALTGCLDSPGGNVLFTPVPAPSVEGRELLPPEQRTKALGLRERPLGPARWGFVTSGDVYRAILEREPYPVRGMVGFGANLVMAHADSRRGRDALAALDFYVHADLFLNPTAELADVVLPVASPFERENLKIGFEGSQEAASLVQLRRRVVDPPGEARSDAEIVFGLATRLGLGRALLGRRHRGRQPPSAQPDGTDASRSCGHVPRGSACRSRPASASSRPSGTGRRSGSTRRPARSSSTRRCCSSTGTPRSPSSRSRSSAPGRGPTWPSASRWSSRPRSTACSARRSTAACRACAARRWTPSSSSIPRRPPNAASRPATGFAWRRRLGSVRARAHLNESLRPDVVVGQHGWWQACPEVGAPGYDPYSAEGANLNLIIGDDAVDPISGSVPHRAYVAQVHRLTD